MSIGEGVGALFKAHGIVPLVTAKISLIARLKFWVYSQLSEKTTLLFLSPLAVEVNSQRKEFAPLGVNSCLYEKTPFQRAS